MSQNLTLFENDKIYANFDKQKSMRQQAFEV